MQGLCIAPVEVHQGIMADENSIVSLCLAVCTHTRMLYTV